MILLLLIAAGLFAVGVLPGRLAGVIVCSVLLLAMIIVVNVAARRQFVVFNRDGSTVPQSLSARFMDPMDKLSLRATGLFEVEGRAGRFTDLQATYRSFQTREHSVMAIVPPSRALLVGRWPDEEIGMWYIFFKGYRTPTHRARPALFRPALPGPLCRSTWSRSSSLRRRPSMSGVAIAVENRSVNFASRRSTSPLTPPRTVRRLWPTC